MAAVAKTGMEVSFVLWGGIEGGGLADDGYRCMGWRS